MLFFTRQSKNLSRESQQIFLLVLFGGSTTLSSLEKKPIFYEELQSDEILTVKYYGNGVWVSLGPLRVLLL